MDEALKKETLHRRALIANWLQANSLLILPAAHIKIRNQDNEFPFRQNSNFYYLTGFTEPDAIFIMRKNNNNKIETILFNHKKDQTTERWIGPRLGQAAAKESLNLDETYPLEAFDTHLIEFIKNATNIYYDLGEHMGLDHKIRRAIKKSGTKHLTTKDVDKKILSLAYKIGQLRLYKSEYEVQQMKNAANIAVEAHLKAIKFTKPGLYEHHLQAEIIHSFLQHGAIEPAYPPIVAAGNNACILHYTKNNCSINDNDLILIDAGCEVEYYASDITRTFPANKKFTTAQQAIYELVLNAQLAGIEAAQVGKPFAGIQQTIVEVLVEGLLQLKLLTGSKESIIKNKTYDKYYMHNSGHWLGLDVHDTGIYKTEKDESVILEPQMALTIEPGLYIAHDLPDIPDEFRGIGIRIEDDIVIQNNGPLVLSEQLPKSIEDLKNI